MKPRLLVTGGAGFLGRHLLQRAREFTSTGTLHRTAAMAIPSVTFHVCDLVQPQDVRILLDRVKPDIIIHTACSDQSGNMAGIPSAAGLLAQHSAERYIRFIHLSTDQVFDGTAAPYSEANEPCPIHPYGEAKTHAETLVRSLNPQAAIVRTSLLYDLRSPDRFITRLIDATTSTDSFNLFIDEWRSPMWVENLAECVLELATKDISGLLHIAGPHALNRWELGMGLLEHFGKPATPNIQQGTIQASGLNRPPNLTLDSSRAQHLLCTPFLSLRTAREQVTR